MDGKYKWTACVDSWPNKNPKFNPSFDENRFVELLDELAEMFDDWLRIDIVMEKEGE